MFPEVAADTLIIQEFQNQRDKMQEQQMKRLMICGRFITVAVLAVAANADAQTTNWPQFRGPESRGVADTEGLPDRWSATENIAWKTDIPGRGWSSPVVWGDRVFLTTVVNLGTAEEPKKGLYFGGNRPTPPDALHQWKVFCLDLASGEVLWERQVHEGKPATPIHLKNSYASETPVTDGAARVLLLRQCRHLLF